MVFQHTQSDQSTAAGDTGLAGKLRSALAGLEETLEGLTHGVMMINSRGEVLVCNSAALELLRLPQELKTHPFTIAEIAPQLAMLELSHSSDGLDATLEIVPGKFVEIRGTPMEHGGIVLKLAPRIAENLAENTTGENPVVQNPVVQNNEHLVVAEYSSLFQNAVCGIYRDQLDGTPVRCNPALATLNGYESESEYISAVTGTHGAWYVDPGRSAEFKRLMKSEGRVKDFVSEVYRHSTREVIWITENAWYVRDGDGNPIFIEGTIQDATDRITNLAFVERQANLDTLTGVASRFRFLRCLEEETLPGKTGCTLYSIDFDRFKEVNDLLGHATGDLVLKLLAKRLQSIVNEPSILARLGGDEFAILQPSLNSQSSIEAMAKKIIASLREPLRISGHDLTLGASVGISMFPSQATGAEDLLGNADFALFQAKAAGRNGFRIFDLELRSDIQHRKELEQDLRDAITGEQLELYYQPIVEGGTGVVQGYEALMRWNHPKRGFLPPSQFIPVAEDAGLMTDLGNWAIKRACQQAAILPPHIMIAVNVSPSQFRSASILVKLRRVLEETRLDPKRLILEITETAILTDEALAEKLLREIQALGVGIALDDFGTGFSSLSYLQRFPFNKVKIDRSFVAGIVDQPANLAVIRAVLGIGRDLGIKVVAEGVETKMQVDALLQEGCKLMQGYYYGKPKPYAEIVGDQSVAELSTLIPKAPDTKIRLVR